ncbi:Cysteine-rich receptor-like protein kinase 25 [Camellia lanceoleosa]|uniref:Cysteine-rich receptor-like protein kinase 25 n=1 Tax=Camellia lanceoleosa TaxID=1840588 RepID=A0ACC0GK59_9ERIC|nr:Cysteine-rich receptor-like protein kinase 25 [Camellia lanceoleosa]
MVGSLPATNGGEEKPRSEKVKGIRQSVKDGQDRDDMEEAADVEDNWVDTWKKCLNEVEGNSNWGTVLVVQNTDTILESSTDGDYINEEEHVSETIMMENEVDGKKEEYNNILSMKKGKDDNTTRTVIIIVVSVISFVIVLMVCICIFLRKRKQNKPTKEVEICKDTDEISNEEPLQYDFDTISVATNNFSDANKLGQGGFGVVYRVIEHSITNKLYPSCLKLHSLFDENSLICLTSILCIFRNRTTTLTRSATPAVQLQEKTHYQQQNPINSIPVAYWTLGATFERLALLPYP